MALTFGFRRNIEDLPIMPSNPESCRAFFKETPCSLCSLRHLRLFIMSSSQLLMLTGGNGFVGYAVLAGLLKAGVRTSSNFTAKAICALAHFYSTPLCSLDVEYKP